MTTMMDRAFHALRTWLGLADASEAHLTPGHGWLLPVPADVLTLRRAAEAARSNGPARGPGVQA
jgi:hypothetical protein